MDDRPFKVVHSASGRVVNDWPNLMDAIQAHRIEHHKDRGEQRHYHVEHNGRIVQHTDPYAKTMWSD